MCIGSTPKYEAPAAPEPEKTADERKARVRDEEARRRAVAAKGMASTMLTAPGALGTAPTQQKTLLGQ